MELAKTKVTPGVEALFYILSGCNELWSAGVAAFYDFETGSAVSDCSGNVALTREGEELLKLGCHLAGRAAPDDLVHVLQSYFPSLGYVHLELAIEAIKLAYFPRD